MDTPTRHKHPYETVGAGAPIGWESLGVLEILEADSRPRIVLDLERPQNIGNPCYCNFAFRRVLDHTFRTGENDTAKAFNYWVYSTSACAGAYQYHGFIWTVTTVRERWRFVAGVEKINSPDTDDEDMDCRLDRLEVQRKPDMLVYLPSYTSVGAKNVPQWAKKRKLDHAQKSRDMSMPPGFDWTLEKPPLNASPHIKMLRAHDWSKTPLGAMHTWCPQLRLMVNLLLADPYPAVLFWGSELAGIYNEAYLPFLTNKHPRSLGEPFEDTWKELYAVPESAELVDMLWETGYKTGKGTRHEHQLFHILLNDKLEEMYFKLGMLPILGKDGAVAGFYEPFIDVTEDHLASRRQLTINKVSDATSGVQTLNDFYSRVLDALRENDIDVPFCLLYSVDAERQKDDNKNHLPVVDLTDFSFAKLEGAIGVQLDGQGRPVALLVRDDRFKASFQDACHKGQCQAFQVDTSLTVNLTSNLPRRGFGDRPGELMLCPIQPMTQKTTAALLVLGLNTRRPLDTAYQTFIRSLTRTISASMASVMLLNMASRRTLEAAQGEQIAKSMLAVAPVGAYLMSVDGEILYANPMWYHITDYNNYENEQKPMSWMVVVADDSRHVASREWDLLLKQRRTRSYELRLKKEWKGTDPVTKELVRGPLYVLAEASIQTIGERDYISGCWTDISRQKWVEVYERKRREEAVELKRQQENFIDMTSHEMRNPLSAIFQSADGIISALAGDQISKIDGDSFKQTPGSSIDPGKPLSPLPGAHRLEDRISYAIDAAQTISLCAQHQKRIVDDVLVLSKADANLLEVSALDVQPKSLIEKSLRMFAAELASNDAQMEFCTEESFSQLGVDWVKLDPSRLLQVLINLCTNAIKFTTVGTVRKIRVAIGASIDPPTGAQYDVRWLPSEEGKIRDPTIRSEWGSGQQFYLSFAVQDTGRGITDAEMKTLFQRFSQGSPRTHTQYGGSGLGLFIAKLLTQLQGGEIGVKSQFNQGSTFAFYIKVRRGRPPVRRQATIDKSGQSLNSTTPRAQADANPTEQRLEQSVMNILVVEDNLVNQKVLRRQLENLGWIVHVANNGREALDFIKTTQVWAGNDASSIALELILMDVEMPIMNGTIATRHIRQLQSEGSIAVHIPIIAITANARLEQVAVALESGMDDVISKPFRVPELISKLEALIRV